MQDNLSRIRHKCEVLLAVKIEHLVQENKGVCLLDDLRWKELNVSQSSTIEKI